MQESSLISFLPYCHDCKKKSHSSWKRRWGVAEQCLWEALSSGKDSLVWNSLGLLMYRARYKKHPSAYTTNGCDVCRKIRICVSSLTSEGRAWSPDVSVDSKSPGFFNFFFNNNNWRNTCVHSNKVLYRRRQVVTIVPLFPPHHPPAM